MEMNDILTLLKAGYTKNEIAQMAQNTASIPDESPVVNPINEAEQEAEPASAPTPVKPTEPASAPTPVKPTEPAPAPTPVKPTEPAPAPAPVAYQPEKQEQITMDDLFKSIAKLTSAVQANAIAQSQLPPGISNPPHPEDMLAEIIRPTFKEVR